MRRLAEVGREMTESNKLICLDELASAVEKTIIRGIYSPVVTIQQVEGLCQQFQLHPVAGIDASSQSHIRAGIIRTKQTIAPQTGQAIVPAIVVLIGIANYTGIYRSPTAHHDHSGEFPVIEKRSQHIVSAAKWTRFGDPGKDESMPLVGYAGAALGMSRI